MEAKTPPLSERLRQDLERYGQADSLDALLAAVRLSYLRDGRMPSRLPEEYTQILTQLGIGWPVLSEAGKALGRECTESKVATSRAALIGLCAKFHPRVIALFLKAFTPGSDVQWARVPADAVDFERDRGGISRVAWVTDLLSERRIHSQLLILVKDIAKLELSVAYTAPAYSNAKWNAVFIGLPTLVADMIQESLDKTDCDLKSAGASRSLCTAVQVAGVLDQRV